jgi:hypothetical protein
LEGFLPIGQLFYLGSFLIISEVAQIFELLISTQMLCIIFYKIWPTFLGEFLTNLPGHLASYRGKFARNRTLIVKEFRRD